MNRKGPIARRQAERYANAVQRCADAAQALDNYINELRRSDKKLMKLWAASDEAEKVLAGMRG